MNRSTFLTSLLALPATVKALAKPIDGDDVVVPDTDFSNIQGGTLYLDGEHIATIESIELGENAEIYYDSSDYKWTSKGIAFKDTGEIIKFTQNGNGNLIAERNG